MRFSRGLCIFTKTAKSFDLAFRERLKQNAKVLTHCITPKVSDQFTRYASYKRPINSL